MKKIILLVIAIFALIKIWFINRLACILQIGAWILFAVSALLAVLILRVWGWL